MHAFADNLVCAGDYKIHKDTGQTMNNIMTEEQACDLFADFEEAKSTIAAYRQAVACLVEGGSPDGVTPEVAARHIREIVDAYDAAQAEVAALRAGAPDGWKLVPVEPTDAMSMGGVKSYGDAFYFKTCHAAECWKAMLAAAPQPPAPEPRGATRILPQTEIDELLGLTGDWPQPPAQEDHSHAARLNRLLGILRRLKWVQNEEATMLSPASPADALNDLGLFMFSDAIDRAANADRLERESAS